MIPPFPSPYAVTLINHFFAFSGLVSVIFVLLQIENKN